MTTEIPADFLLEHKLAVKNLLNDIELLPEEGDPKLAQKVEKLHEVFKEKVGFFQEQSYLLDDILKELVLSLIEIIRRYSDEPNTRFHISFKFLHLLTKTRGYKVVIRQLPHEVADVETVLRLLSLQVPDATDDWETRYILLLWLSILLLIPLDLKRFDSCVGGAVLPMTDRIYQLIKTYVNTRQGVLGEAAAFLSAKFLVRPEIQEAYIPSFIEWSLNMIKTSSETNIQLNILKSLAYLYKFGKRDVLNPFSTSLLQTVSDLKLFESKHDSVIKILTKLTQRIGLNFLKVRVASWRYQRGKRFLGDTLGSGDSEKVSEAQALPNEMEIDDDNYDVPPEMDDVIEILLNGLRHDWTNVRWSSAKGLGRIANRLPKDHAEQIVSAVLELFSYREQDGAWHGGCLTLAEFGRRGLILPSKLGEVVKVTNRALVYDELKGTYVVGSHVRDAACYICWAFARAYDAETMRPFVDELAASLLSVALFDKEISCRRAAAAAFQENVGRQGEFPDGIAILASVDYLGVGLRRHAYIDLAIFVASFEVYRTPLIQHLLQFKIVHWDPEIRELAAESLYHLCLLAPDEVVLDIVIPRLTTLTLDYDLNLRHGSLLALGHVLTALSEKKQALPVEVVDHITRLTSTYTDKKYFGGVGGELTKHSMCVLITKASETHLPIHANSQLVTSWINIILDTVFYVSKPIRDHGVAALAAFSMEYLQNDPDKRSAVLEKLFNNIYDSKEHVRCGIFESFEVCPLQFLNNDVGRCLEALLKYVIHECGTLSVMTLARAAAVKALSGLSCKLVAYHKTEQLQIGNLFDALQAASSDYTKKSNGDAGYPVRKAAIESMHVLVLAFNKGYSHLITSDQYKTIIQALFSHSVCSHQQLRKFAVNAIVEIVQNCDKFIPHYDELHNAFGDVTPEATEDELLDRCLQVLPVTSYTTALWEGLVTSIGGKTVSTASHFRSKLTSYLKQLKPKDNEAFSRVLANLFETFKNNITVDRLTTPFFQTYNYLISSGFTDSRPEAELKEIIFISRKNFSTSADTERIQAGNSLICSLLRTTACVKPALSQLVVALCHKFTKVRQVVADELSVALMTYSDLIFEEDEAGSAKYEEALELLSDTDWKQPVPLLRPIRNKLCSLLGIGAPVPAVKAVVAQS